MRNKLKNTTNWGEGLHQGTSVQKKILITTCGVSRNAVVQINLQSNLQIKVPYKLIRVWTEMSICHKLESLNPGLRLWWNIVTSVHWRKFVLDMCITAAQILRIFTVKSIRKETI